MPAVELSQCILEVTLNIDGERDGMISLHAETRDVRPCFFNARMQRSLLLAD